MRKIFVKGFRYRENKGKNAHALLTAPNPLSRPSKAVPRTTKRLNAVVNIPDEGSADGSGI
jgi:hypothetical protein